MALREEMEQAGNWLFRWRSYVPLIMLLPLLLAMRQFERPMHNHALQELWEFICFAVSLTGLVLRGYTVGHTPPGTSGRNTRGQVADALNTTGMYSIVRHPLYVGNFLMWLGAAMFCLVWWLVAVFVLAFYLYYERIMLAEEEFLRRKFGGRYTDWAAQTPAFLPAFGRWRASAQPFSIRKALRQEYTGFLGLTLGFFCLETAEHFAIEKHLIIETWWAVLAALGCAAYVTLRTIKKHTSLLSVHASL